MHVTDARSNESCVKYFSICLVNITIILHICDLMKSRAFLSSMIRGKLKNQIHILMASAIARFEGRLSISLEVNRPISLICMVFPWSITIQLRPDIHLRHCRAFRSFPWRAYLTSTIMASSIEPWSSWYSIYAAFRWQYCCFISQCHGWCHYW